MPFASLGNPDSFLEMILIILYSSQGSGTVPICRPSLAFDRGRVPRDIRTDQEDTLYYFTSYLNGHSGTPDDIRMDTMLKLAVKGRVVYDFQMISSEQRPDQPGFSVRKLQPESIFYAPHA